MSDIVLFAVFPYVAVALAVFGGVYAVTASPTRRCPRSFWKTVLYSGAQCRGTTASSSFCWRTC
jgi:hypothetical protein